MRKILLHPAVIFLIGLATGAAAKLFDLYSRELGLLFSDLTVWILFGVLISLYSGTKKKAALNVFLFFIGMLLTYYVVAEWTNAVYSLEIALQWVGITLVISFLGCIVWMVNEGGILSIALRIGISVVCIASALLFMRDSFEGVLLNCLIILILLYHLWFRKKNLIRWRKRAQQKRQRKEKLR